MREPVIGPVRATSILQEEGAPLARRCGSSALASATSSASALVAKFAGTFLAATFGCGGTAAASAWGLGSARESEILLLLTVNKFMFQATIIALLTTIGAVKENTNLRAARASVVPLAALATTTALASGVALGLSLRSVAFDSDPAILVGFSLSLFFGLGLLLGLGLGFGLFFFGFGGRDLFAREGDVGTAVSLGQLIPIGPVWIDFLMGHGP